ncbi:MAG: DUF1566 domain-containing protein [Myxococcota bacterium]|jgi:hypothetical protein|nr:DUF1566 domain-containing protein [Myxococcota bacterium]
MTVRYTIALALFCLAMSAIITCGDDSESTGPITVQGAMQKGPLLKGSTLTVSMLGQGGAPTGVNYNTTTTSDLGEFKVVSQTSGPCELVGEGFYFNEIANSLSGAPITLRAVYEIVSTGSQNAYLNAFTHMSSGLALRLLTEGKSVDEAVAQAETKLFEALGIAHPSGALEANGTAMDLMGADSPDNQYIMATSCILAKAAQMRATDPGEVDARLQELLNDIRSQLQNSETISQAYRGYLKDAEAALDPLAGCVDNLAAYLEQKTGTSPVLPDPNQSMDMDKDGIFNSKDEDIDGDGVLNEHDHNPYDSSVYGKVWVDVSTGLMWQSYPYWSGEWEAAIAYCDALELGGYTDWSLPTISELRSLVRGCDATMTGGTCGVTDECLTDDCYNDSCLGCQAFDGPGLDGCHWDVKLGGPCWVYWSSLSDVNSSDGAWYVEFEQGRVNTIDKDSTPGHARCVRGRVGP